MRKLDSHLARVRRLADAVLYEGYLLYPYRQSSQKNQRRWLFGTLVPRIDSEALGGLEPWRCQTECLIEAEPSASLELGVRFLHFGLRTAGDALAHSTFEDASERTVAVGPVALDELIRQPLSHPFRFAGEAAPQRTQHEVSGCIEVAAHLAAPGVVRLRVQVMNLTPAPAPAETAPAGQQSSSLRALASVHALLMVQDGAFVSQIDPGPRLQPWAAECRNEGLFPVLVGEPGTRDLMLCSPIILYDHPAIAAQSPGDLFDATEIDEILTLRLLTLSADEKREIAAGDERARQLLARVEQLGEAALAQLHGRMHSPQQPRRTTIAGVSIGPGARVLLRPRTGGDVLDLALAGRTARVSSVEEDFEGRVYVTVTVEDDPGQDLGQHGHRFFFSCDEVEPLLPQGAQT